MAVAPHTPQLRQVSVHLAASRDAAEHVARRCLGRVVVDCDCPGLVAVFEGGADPKPIVMALTEAPPN